MLPPDLTFSQFTINIRQPARHTSSAAIIWALESLLIATLWRHSPVPPVFSARFFFIVVVFIVMQHSRVTPFGWNENHSY